MIAEGGEAFGINGTCALRVLIIHHSSFIIPNERPQIRIANPSSAPFNPPPMKLRNQLLALFCLGLFAAFGFFYIRLWVVQKPFGIILFVSDGMVTRHLTAARLYKGGAANQLELEAFPHLAMMSNAALDRAVADDAAAATALATGQKVAQRNLSTGLKGQSLQDRKSVV